MALWPLSLWAFGFGPLSPWAGRSSARKGLAALQAVHSFRKNTLPKRGEGKV